MNGITLGSAASYVINQGSNGAFRISALLANVLAIQMAGELSLRLIAGAFHSIGWKLEQNDYVGKVSKFIDKNGLRPYGAAIPKKDSDGVPVKDASNVPILTYKYSTTDLVVRLLALTVLAVVAFEAATFLCGPAPAIYNNVLTFMGPLRVEPRSYLVTTGEVVASLRKGFGI